MFKKRYTTPGGNIPGLYVDMAKQTHLLIAGKTGSGKSVVINGIIYGLLSRFFPGECNLILMDPKRVELSQYSHLPHCMYYATEQRQNAVALDMALSDIELRFSIMQRNGEKRYKAGETYIVIDELADLMTTDKNTIVPRLQRIAQIGRAAGYHIIAGTQCPLTEVIPTKIKVNFDSIMGLKTVTRQHSRNILDMPGCELLPRYGQGFYRTPDGTQKVLIPMIPETELNRIVKHWEH